MKILHITPSTDGYEEVILLANRYDQKNHLAVIEKDGEQFITGGFLIQDTPMTRTALDQIPKDFQYLFVQSFKSEPFAKSYFNKENN
jgi:GTPase SAR1 family protein|tara:strand:- start:556 stop:816 length:261 start_codon:yes stop_codon:yes gene_type:complete